MINFRASGVLTFFVLSVQCLKVPMARKFLLADVKEYLKLQYKFFHTFVLQRLVDEIFQFEFFVLPANYVTFCIMRHQKVDYKVFFP